jgi:hypothetical protein
MLVVRGDQHVVRAVDVLEVLLPPRIALDDGHVWDSKQMRLGTEEAYCII